MAAPADDGAPRNASRPLVQKRSPHRGQRRARRRLPAGRCAGAGVRDGRRPAQGASRRPSTPPVPARLPPRSRRRAGSRGVPAHRPARRTASLPSGPRPRVQGVPRDLEPRLRPVRETPGPCGTRCPGTRRGRSPHVQGPGRLRGRRDPRRPWRDLHCLHALPARVVAAVPGRCASPGSGSRASGGDPRGTSRRAPGAARTGAAGGYDRHPARGGGAGPGAAGRLPRRRCASLPRRPRPARGRRHLQALAVPALRRDLGARMRARGARAGRGRVGGGGGGQDVDRRAGVARVLPRHPRCASPGARRCVPRGRRCAGMGRRCGPPPGVAGRHDRVSDRRCRNAGGWRRPAGCTTAYA